MNPALIAGILSLLQLLIQKAPELASEVGEVISLVKDGRDPTPEQEARIRELTDRAHAEAMDEVDRKIGPPA